MKKTKKTIIIAAAIILIAGLIVAAILMLKTDSFGMNATKRKKAVAVVGGTEKITANELANSYLNYYTQIENYNSQLLMYYGVSYYDLSTDEAKNELKNEMLDSLVEERAAIVLAGQKGITLTAEEKAECEATGKANYDSLVQEYVDGYASSGYTDAKSYALTSVAQYLIDYGFGNKTEFIRRATKSAEASALKTKLLAKLSEESGITAEKASELYADWAANFETNYYAGSVAQQDANFITGSASYRYLYIPEGFVFVRVINLGTDKARAEALVAEIGTDAEVFEKYCASEENTDGLMKLVAADEGYAIGESDSSFSSEVYTAAAAMNVGDIALVTVPAATTESTETESAEASYYIIRRIDGQTGIVPFEKVSEAVVNDLVTDKQTEYAETTIHEWISAEGNVVIDEALLAEIKVA